MLLLISHVGMLEHTPKSPRKLKLVSAAFQFMNETDEKLPKAQKPIDLVSSSKLAVLASRLKADNIDLEMSARTRFLFDWIKNDRKRILHKHKTMNIHQCIVCYVYASLTSWSLPTGRQASRS